MLKILKVINNLITKIAQTALVFFSFGYGAFDFCTGYLPLYY